MAKYLLQDKKSSAPVKSNLFTKKSKTAIPAPKSKDMKKKPGAPKFLRTRADA